MKAKEIVAANVRRFRQMRGWTQAELAEHMEVHTNRISIIESAKHDLQTDTIDRIALALGVTAAQLMSPQAVEIPSGV